MNATKMRAFFGIVGLAGAGFLFSSVTTSTSGCSSSGGSTGSAGTQGSAGTTGTAGTQGTAGTTGSGGNGGGGGGTATLGCELSDAPAGGAVIADFMTMDGGTLVYPIGGTFVYGSPAPVATVTSGAWHVTLTAPGTASAQYLGVGIYFNGNPEGTHCVDALPYTGIQFDISGSVTGTGCTMQYATNDSAHGDAVANPSDKKISGPAGSYAPQATIALTDITSTVKTMMMPFMGAGAPSGGSPATSVDKQKLTGVQWQFTVAGATTNSCMVDITIDNVKFY